MNSGDVNKVRAKAKNKVKVKNKVKAKAKVNNNVMYHYISGKLHTQNLH